MSKKISNSVSSVNSSRIKVSLTKVFSDNGLHLVEICPECGDIRITKLKNGDCSCLNCKWKGQNFVLKCAYSPSMVELITLISKQAAIQKDIIWKAQKAKIRLPIEVLQAEVSGVEA